MGTPQLIGGLPLVPSTQEQTDQTQVIVHVVKAEDNLWDIASQHGISGEELYLFNIRYNWAEFSRHNMEPIPFEKPALDIALYQQVQSGLPLSDVPVEIRPGQKILIPSIGSCQSGFASIPEETYPQEVANCGDNEDTHNDLVYVLAGTQPIDDYVENDPVVQSLLDRIEEGTTSDTQGTPSDDDGPINYATAIRVVEDRFCQPLREKAGQLMDSCTSTRWWGTLPCVFRPAGWRSLSVDNLASECHDWAVINVPRRDNSLLTSSEYAAFTAAAEDRFSSDE